jgi:hypothetical protein
MRASDIAKLAASIGAGYITYEAASNMLSSDGDKSMLDSIIAGAAGGIAGGLVGELMDSTGATDMIDDVFGEMTGDWF